MSNTLPNAMATLNLNVIPKSSALAEPSKNWLTFDEIRYATPLDSTIKDVYWLQLQELRGVVARATERSVEQFVAMEEMEALTWDFRGAVTEATREREEKEKQAQETAKAREVLKAEADGESAGEVVIGTWKGSESAEKWRLFRRAEK